MQYSEDDMNELFRKAAENYSPKKGDSYWQDISHKITGQLNKDKFAPAKKTRFPKKYMVLMFLFIGIAGGLVVFKNTRVDKKELIAERPKTIALKQNTSGKYFKGNNISSHITHPTQGSYYHRSLRQAKLKNSTVASIQIFNKNARRKPLIISDYTYTNSEIVIISRKGIHLKNKGAKTHYLFPDYNANKSTDTVVNEFDKERHTGVVLDKIGTIEKEDKSKSSTTNVFNKQRGVYVGLATAIDISKVKSSPVDNAGYAFGIIAGYKINRTVSLETGLLLNKRNYNSEGRYFDMAKISSSMPSGMQIKSLYTSSAVIELPFKVKVGLINFTRSAIFITSGVSAYMITRQKNNYQASLNGNDEQFSAMYSKNDFLLPAALNTSIGYEQAISKVLNIKAEPFLKIPLRGMGVGNLPVTSAGMQLSITRKLN